MTQKNALLVSPAFATLVRFSHDSNMFRQNVTEGAGRLRYSFPGVRSARGFAGLGACCKRAASGV